MHFIFPHSHLSWVRGICKFLSNSLLHSDVSRPISFSRFQACKQATRINAAHYPPRLSTKTCVTPGRKEEGRETPRRQVWRWRLACSAGWTSNSRNTSPPAGSCLVCVWHRVERLLRVLHAGVLRITCSLQPCELTYLIHYHNNNMLSLSGISDCLTLGRFLVSQPDLTPPAPTSSLMTGRYYWFHFILLQEGVQPELGQPWPVNPWMHGSKGRATCVWLCVFLLSCAFR